jgi:hypothetical protein
MNKYITGPFEKEGLNFTVDDTEHGWLVNAKFPSGRVIQFYGMLATEAQEFITNTTAAFVEGKKEAKP